MKNGFTLIEVLAVVIIIGLLSIVVTSVVSDSIYDSRKQAFISSCINLSNKAEEYMNDNIMPEPNKFIYVDIDNLDMKNKNKLDPNTTVVFANHGTASNPIIIPYVYTSNDYFISNGINPEFLNVLVEEKSGKTLQVIDGTLLSIQIWNNYNATAHFSSTRFSSTSSLKAYTN